MSLPFQSHLLYLDQFGVRAENIIGKCIITKLDLYKKLTDPKVNETLKRQWFEKFILESGDM